MTTILTMGCGGGGHAADGGADARKPDGPPAKVDAKSDAVDGSTLDDGGSCVGDALTKSANGEACSCNSGCSSGFCVDGVCCNSACGEACKTCKASGSVGTCTSVAAGSAPRVAAACSTSDVSSCGFDGTCDGAGACRRYTAGTVCVPGKCEGAAVVGALVCDGEGRCRAGAATVCAPFQCDPKTNACFDTCAQSSECTSGQQCVGGSCGPKMKGASCKQSSECASGFCADGVCCNVACSGGCISCALVGRRGTCWPIDADAPDPRAVCQDQGAPSCGTTGTCDGFGGCQKYAAETECIAPTCTATRRNTPGTCDGVGSCKPQGVQNCAPYQCVGTSCIDKCVTNADCEAGHVCVNGSCGPKANGQSCAKATDCASAFCVDGLCCDTACTGACLSCALASASGKCTPIAANNVDPRGVCQDLKAASCATNGRCDGAGGCQKYKMGTVCASESCAQNVYHPASTCSAIGQCVAPPTTTCYPYTCNGNACFPACTANANCVAPNVCNVNSCGPKPNGSSCSAANECQSTFCAQGYCCDKACNGACQSCGLTGALGKCTNVPTNANDPAGICKDQGGCGTTGKCQAGACQKYANGITCKGAVCSTTTMMSTGTSTCDGNGACVTPGSTTCFPFACGTTACKGSCASNADCISPAVCTGGSCGLKGNGQQCGGANECQSNFCSQGVCCNTACTGICQSCSLSMTNGACTNVARGGSDPSHTCRNMDAASCKQDGTCDGAGACKLYPDGTTCGATESCTGSTRTPPSSCAGGVCVAPLPPTVPCNPYKCTAGSSTCPQGCTADTDCVSPTRCINGTCGTDKRQGESCGATDKCIAGTACIDGVCCAATSCGDAAHGCLSCAVPGHEGTCFTVPEGAPAPDGRCAPTAGNVCGNTGLCGKMGLCDQADASVQCAPSTCQGTVFTPKSFCNGNGACAPAAPTTCMASGQCQTATCSGSGCSSASKPNDTTCDDGNGCTPSSTCQQGTCFGMVSCNAVAGACQAGMCINGACSAVPVSDNTACTDDQNPCTADVCQSGTCKHVPLNAGTACTDDGNACTVDSCSGTGVCGHAAKNCDDGNPCTTDTCNAQTGACINTSGGGIAANACCADGDCADNNPCTTDTCTASHTCSNVSNGGKVCNGACIAASGCCADGDCVDTNPCTTDTCTAAHTCSNVSSGGKVCNGACIPANGCCADGDCADNNPCTTDTCTAAHTCSNVSNGGQVCNGACIAGNGCCGDGDCVDNNPCTTDSCTASHTCSNVSNGGKVCNGACFPAGACCADTDCPNDNPCSTMSCMAHACVPINAADGALCGASGDMCTVCTNGTCGPRTCNDGICDPTMGCAQ